MNVAEHTTTYLTDRPFTVAKVKRSPVLCNMSHGLNGSLEVSKNATFRLGCDGVSG